MSKRSKKTDPDKGTALAMLRAAFGMALATMSMGARGFSCGPCDSTQTVVRPVLPAANGADASRAPPAPGVTLSAAECTAYCGMAAISCKGATLDSGTPAVECTIANNCGGAGRRPHGFASRRRTTGDVLTAWLAGTAALEGAAVDAFVTLRAELAAHKAPRALLRACTRAARDEVAHARVMGELTRRRGGPIVPWTRAPRRRRSLEAIAIENAVEGCVRETWAALCAWVQTADAEDADVRKAMARIAKDETEHAALALEVDTWTRTRLRPSARRRVDAARQREIKRLVRTCGDVAPALARRAGIPAGARAHVLCEALFRSLDATRRETLPRRIDAAHD
jgi:hypothetical protein